MTPYKLERNTFNGKTLYTYVDKQKGVVYIGGDKAYERYKELGIQQSLAEKELEASYSNYLVKLRRAKCGVCTTATRNQTRCSAV
jgi:hypothetical protein